jgi:hypothetical protein
LSISSATNTDLDSPFYPPPISATVPIMDSQGSSEKRFQAEEIERRDAYDAAPAGFGQKAKRHCSRFWWLHLIVFCVIFLIVALCL